MVENPFGSTAQGNVRPGNKALESQVALLANTLNPRNP